MRVDGQGGYVISDNEDLGVAYANVLAYSQYMTFTVTPLLKLDDAVGPIAAYLS